MSKSIETAPESQGNKKTLKPSYISYINLEKNIPKQKSKSKSNVTKKEKESNNSYKKEFSYIPKNSNSNLNKNNNPDLTAFAQSSSFFRRKSISRKYSAPTVVSIMPYNVYEFKRSIINVKYPDNIENIIQEKQKGITLSNKIEKNKMPIFIKKIPIENDLRQKKYSDN